MPGPTWTIRKGIGPMGLMGRIRHWVGRHWCRDLAELREQVQRSVNDRDLLAAQGRQIQNLLVTIRELTEHNVRSLAEMAAAHKKLLAEDLREELLRVIRAHGLVGCRLDALAERLGVGASEQRVCNNSEQEGESVATDRERERIKPPP